ncbi:hypothetical protein L612_002000000560 [Rhodococcus rhodochrous J38]|uniref:hypothetical protein n=1 Tax=Rhodococcus rhodochrous TaxID=1829 RepID=UPI0011A42878|nr:hypothetical protein [Rhodococcus rhodochrous]TWH52645.1 hypothetical protein L612_002000000560 [Rhodococcus rhodochrous J38]
MRAPVAQTPDHGQRGQSRCRTRPGDPEDLEPDELFALLEIDGAMVMVVDTDWNGINYYGFAPVETDE